MSDKDPNEPQEAGPEPEEPPVEPPVAGDELSLEERLAARRQELAESREELAESREELAERDEADAEAETYRRRVAILLAVVAVVGAWIAVLQINASTNESAAARETTRTAVRAQAAAVVTQGIDAMQATSQAEVQTLPLRATFTENVEDLIPESELPFTNAERVSIGVDIAQETAANLIAGDPELAFDLKVEQRATALERDALTEERITWNARASQYQTVLTVLGVSLFLIGFTLVLSRRVRPPILIPGVILVVYCAGWAIWIYNKPIPDVDRDAITDTAVADVLFDDEELDASIDSFNRAIEADDNYLPPYAGRSLAYATVANPDLFRTFAIVDNSSEAFQAAVDDALRAIDLDGEDDITTLAVGSILAAAADRYDIADETVTRALEINATAPGLHLFASAVDVALGDVEAARQQLEDGLALVQPSEPSGRIRTLSANYLSWLGLVELQNPDLGDDVAQLSEQMIAAEAYLTDGVEQTGEAPDGAGITLNSVTYAEDEMVVDLELEGVDDQDYISVVIFERPSEDGPWVNAPNLAFVGPAVVTRSQGNPVPAVRACAPVEFRADLYVEGVFVGSDFAPGVSATC